MWNKWKRWFILVALPFFMWGCATAPVAIHIPCIVPQALDYRATGPELLPVEETPVDKHLRDEVRERGAHARLAGDYNALVDHVKGRCQ